MKRCICTILIAVAATLVITAQAQASALFPPAAVYTEQFTDVQSDDWFYDNVASLYALGLTNGKGDPSLFAPDSSMTVAEALTMAARIHSLHQYGAAETGADLFRADGLSWYAPYVLYLQSEKLITTEFDDRFHTSATRAEMAHILAAALPAELFAEINADAVALGYASGKFIADVDDYTPYQQDILALYRRGILSGTDTQGTFLPNASIKRCEVAAMITRLVDPELRITLDWATEEKDIYSLSDLIRPGEYITAPDPADAAAIDEVLRYMLSRGERTLTLSYPSPSTSQSAEALMQSFLYAVRRYPEQTYNKISIKYYTNNGEVTLYFSSSLYTDKLIDSYRETIFTSAVQVRDSLYESGALNASMTQFEKARAYFTWMCENCEYDLNCGKDAMGHSAYNVFCSGLAVCDGYTAAYNLLLGLEGIECRAIDLASADHMWTIATLDGISYHIDPTWGDQTDAISYDYFAMTEESSMARFQ